MTTDAVVQETMTKGAHQFVTEELAKAATALPTIAQGAINRQTQCPNNDAACLRDNFTAFPLQRAFLSAAISAPDQMRQRVAWALSQILVTSMGDVPTTYAMRQYQQMLRAGAFGNYRDLLMRITLSPTMGTYLDMVNNAKEDPARGTEPNENYARELLQLFSIGKVRLNADGTRQLDPQGMPVPAYEQDTIENFAKVFTGWTYPTRAGSAAAFPNPENYDGDMIAMPAQHDTTAKTLLNGTVIPANQTAMKDVEDAINNVFNHPNVGPFIGKQLIQFLVTSNPTPAYVGRVTAVFNNNGSGVRGDLAATVRQILLDPEARGEPATKAAANYGQLREPVLYVTNLVRGLGGTSDGVHLLNATLNNANVGLTGMGQPPMDSPTVFNFYPPDYKAPGTDILGPQFKIVQSTTSLARANFVYDLLITRNEQVAAAGGVAGATGTQLNSSTLNPLAANPAALVDRVATIFGNNTMTAAEKGAIVTAVTALPANDAAMRVRSAVYLVVTSTQFQVAK